MTFAAWFFAFQVKLRKSTDAIRFNPKLQKTVNSYKKKSGIGEEHTKITNVSTVEDARSGMWILFWPLKEIHFICKHILRLRCILPTFIRLRECSLNSQEHRHSDYFLPQISPCCMGVKTWVRSSFKKLFVWNFRLDVFRPRKERGRKFFFKLQI